MQLHQLLPFLRAAAPEHLAAPWDKVGLQVGRAQARVQRGLLCIDLTPAVAAEAKRLGCQLVVSYHPPLFRPAENLTDAHWRPQMLRELVRADLAVYTPHTALDAVRGGITDALCAGLGAGGSVPIQPAAQAPTDLKLVVFVPPEALVKVRTALAHAGAGGIGRYTECSFETPGTGGFRPMPGARPAKGRVGRRERVAEIRLEMLCPAARLAAAVAALRAAHPYEEPAFDILPLKPEPADPTKADGAGRILTLDTPVPAAKLAERLRQALKCKALSMAEPPAFRGRPRHIRTIAVCPGSGGSLFEQAPLCDAYVTGEMQHHQALDLAQRGATVLLAGHTQTERPFLRHYRQRLKAHGAAIDWRISKADQPALAAR